LIPLRGVFSVCITSSLFSEYIPHGSCAKRRNPT
jgi:hypothetical protein